MVFVFDSVCMFIHLCILNHPCIPGMKATQSWCLIFLKYC
jgi:hypothetical protein